MRRLPILVAVHFAALVGSTCIAFGRTWPAPVGILHLALVFAQSGLLGLGGNLVIIRLRTRLIGLAIGLLCLASAIFIAENRTIDVDEFVVISIVIASPALTVWLVLKRLRDSRRALVLTHCGDLSAAAEGLQFTIRHLLIATTIVAMVRVAVVPQA